MPPEKPPHPNERNDRPRTTFPCGLADDQTTSKHWGSKSEVRAGKTVKLRLLPKDPKKPYDLVDCFGSVVSEDRVIFTERFSTEEKRIAFARKGNRQYNDWKEEADEEFEKGEQNFQNIRKQWELEVVYDAWDKKWGKFPPNVRREHLGDKKVDLAADIPKIDPSTITDMSENPNLTYCEKCGCDDCEACRRGITLAAHLARDSRLIYCVKCDCEACQIRNHSMTLSAPDAISQGFTVLQAAKKRKATEDDTSSPSKSTEPAKSTEKPVQKRVRFAGNSEPIKRIESSKKLFKIKQN